MSTIQANVIAIQDAPDNTVGAIVWWRLSGRTGHDYLVSALTEAGVDENVIPFAVAPGEALSRAIRSCADKRILARPLGRNAGWALVRETVENEDLEYETLLKAKLDKAGDTAKLQVDSVDLPLVAKVQTAYHYALSGLTTQDISTWLSRTVMPHLNAVALRKGGGIYFIPRDRMADLRRVTEGLNVANPDHDVYEVPAMHSEEAVRAVMDAVIAEADVDLEFMENEFERGDLGERALRNRQSKCGRMLTKLDAYERLLGQSMDNVRDRVERFQAEVVTAAMMAGADEDDG